MNANEICDVISNQINNFGKPNYPAPQIYKKRNQPETKIDLEKSIQLLNTITQNIPTPVTPVVINMPSRPTSLTPDYQKRRRERSVSPSVHTRRKRSSSRSVSRNLFSSSSEKSRRNKKGGANKKTRRRRI